MKKLSRICLSLLVMFSVAFSLTACGKKVVESATVSSLSLTVVRGEDLDTSKAVVTAKYKKGGTKTFSGKDLEFGEIDTSELTNQELSIKIVPENYTFNVTIRVVASEADVCAITKLESELLAEYHANRTNNGEFEKFEHKTEPIYVGTRNPFHFRLRAAGIGADGETLVPTVENVRTVITVERKLGENNYQLLTGDELDAVVEIDEINAVFKFKNEQATDDLDNPGGAKYRITVTAANPDTDYEEANYSFSAEVVVVKDGFNVYDTIDLSVYDNFNTSANPLYGNSDYDKGREYSEHGWKIYHDQLKGRYHYSDDEFNALLNDSLTLIFQDDIELTDQNVRTDFFWDAEDDTYPTYEAYSEEDVVLGTPHNISEYALFHRTIDNGEKLNVVGNYFAIDASRIPLMVSCEFEGKGVSVNSSQNEGVIAYSALFRTMPTHGQVITNSNTKVEYRNMAFIGNGSMTGKAETSGALLLMKHDEVNFYGYNTTANNFCTTYYFAYGNPNNPNDGHYVIEDCRGFNSYSSLIYMFGAEKVDIIGSTFKYAGGPAILAECEEGDAGEYYNYELPEYADYRVEGEVLLHPDINLIESEIESKLSGHEGWFTTYTHGLATGAVGQIMQLGRALTAQGTDFSPYDATGRTIVAPRDDVPADRIDIQCIIFGDGIVTNTQVLEGTINVFETYEDYEIHYGLNGKEQANKTTSLNLEDPMIARGMAAGYELPVFQCVETGEYRTAPAGTEDGEGLMENEGEQLVWSGDYVNLYCPGNFGYMGILLGLY